MELTNGNSRDAKSLRLYIFPLRNADTFNQTQTMEIMFQLFGCFVGRQRNSSRQHTPIAANLCLLCHTYTRR